jgi:hypothetical protein
MVLFTQSVMVGNGFGLFINGVGIVHSGRFLTIDYGFEWYYSHNPLLLVTGLGCLLTGIHCS